MKGRNITIRRPQENTYFALQENYLVALVAALDGFDDALKEAHPTYESDKGIINSHQGLDNDGKVTDREKAVETVKEFGEKLKEDCQLVDEPGKALCEAIKVFRDAIRPQL